MRASKVCCVLMLIALPCGFLCAASGADQLPAGYFRLLESGAAKVEQRLNEEPKADLKALESRAGWRHFPYAILAPAVLYAKKHPANTHYRDPKMLALESCVVLIEGRYFGLCGCVFFGNPGSLERLNVEFTGSDLLTNILSRIVGISDRMAW